MNMEGWRVFYPMAVSAGAFLLSDLLMIIRNFMRTAAEQAKE